MITCTTVAAKLIDLLGIYDTLTELVVNVNIGLNSNLVYSFLSGIFSSYANCRYFIVFILLVYISFFFLLYLNFFVL